MMTTLCRSFPLTWKCNENSLKCYGGSSLAAKTNHLYKPKSWKHSKVAFRIRNLSLRFKNGAGTSETKEISKDDRSNRFMTRRRLQQSLLLFGMISIFTLVPSSNSNAFSLFGKNDEKDPIEPFTIYGTTNKKYLIEDIVDGKVVGRKRGFTAKTCVQIQAGSRSSLLSKISSNDNNVDVSIESFCEKGEGQDRIESCSRPCENSCGNAISAHLKQVKQNTGYFIEEDDKKKFLTSCVTQCMLECTRPGISSFFILNF